MNIELPKEIQESLIKCAKLQKVHQELQGESILAEEKASIAWMEYYAAQKQHDALWEEFMFELIKKV